MLSAGLLALLLSVSEASAQARNPLLARSPRPKDFEAPRAKVGHFAIELPKEWQLSPGFGNYLFVLTEKTKSQLPSASIIVEQWALQAPVAASDVNDEFISVLMADLKTREPAGQDFRQSIEEVDGRRLIIAQYIRPGIVGPTRVVQYLVPEDRILYRLYCIAPVKEFAKYQATCAHVAATFKPTPP